jgi:ethanolamine utilization cobalamin adenosyltransferase
LSKPKLILESDVRAMARGSRLVIEKGTIITPAALDSAHERDITLDRRSGSGQSGLAGASKSKECLWHKMLAEPGKYLVEVNDGNAVVWLLGDNGPVAYGRDKLENHR